MTGNRKESLSLEKIVAYGIISPKYKPLSHEIILKAH